MNKTTQCLRTLLLIAIVSVCVTGCSKGPRMNHVTGKVTLDGATYAGIGIRFEPISEKRAPGLALTTSDGTYTVAYPGGKLGTPAGEYKVIFFVQETDDAAPKFKIPAKYGENSEVRATVNNGKNEINFDLTTSN